MSSQGRQLWLQKQTQSTHWLPSLGFQFVSPPFTGPSGQSDSVLFMIRLLLQTAAHPQNPKSLGAKGSVKPPQGHRKTQVPRIAHRQWQLEQFENVPQRKMHSFFLLLYKGCKRQPISFGTQHRKKWFCHATSQQKKKKKPALNEHPLRTGLALKEGFAYQVNACTWHSPTFAPRLWGAGW